nr:FadR/GntR family transcriptional regulator [Acidocella sp.]
MLPDQLDSESCEPAGTRIPPGKRLGEHLYEAILTMITRQKLTEGARLPPENELATLFGVSRPIVRETLARLREEGIIVSRRGSGSYVSRRATPADGLSEAKFDHIDSFEQIQKCYEFRKAIEGEAAFLAASNHTPESLESIREACASLGRDVAAGELGGNTDFEFHLAVAKSSGNEWFASALLAMRSQIELTIDIARSLSLNRSTEHLDTVQAEHVAVVEAIAGGDPVKSRNAMREHLTKTCSRIFRGPQHGASQDKPGSD